MSHNLPKEAAAAAQQSIPPKKGTAQSIDKIRRSWRSLASSIVVSTRAAEKVITTPQSLNELDDAIAINLRARIDFHRYCNLLEQTLTGQAKETEALEGFMRSQPNLGRKRKGSGSNGSG